MAWSPHPPVPVALTSGCSTSGTGVLLVGSRRAPAEAPRRKHEPMRRSSSGRPAGSLTRFWLGLNGRRADSGSSVSADLTPDARADAASQRQQSSGGNAAPETRVDAALKFRPAFRVTHSRKHEPMRRSSSSRPSESLTAGNTSRCGLPVAVVKLPRPSASLRDSRVCVAGKLSGGRRCVPRLNRALAARLQSPLPARRGAVGLRQEVSDER